MNLKNRLSTALGLQKASWQPYTGPYGGEGWLNPATGEVRYQDEKPAPGEGEEEGESYQDATSLDAEDDKYETDLGAYFEQGESVMLDGEMFDQEESVETEVTDIFEHNGKEMVEVADPSMEGQGHGFEIVLDDLDGESLEQVVSGPPDDDWESGWMEAPETEELIEGQTVEVYDTNAGEYVAAQVAAVNEEEGTTSLEVQATEAWEPDEDSAYEEGDAIVAGEDSPFAVTAAEELTTTEDARPIELDEALDLSYGDEVLYDHHEPGVTEAEVRGKKLDDDNNLQVELETDEGHLVETQVDETWTSIYDEPVEWADPEEVLGLDFEDPESTDWGILDGHHVAVDHPVHGEEQGPAEVFEDPQGYTWLSVGEPGQPETIEVGDFEVAEGDPIEVSQASSVPGGSPTEYEGTFQGPYDGPAVGDYSMEVDGDTIAFDAEDLAAVDADHDDDEMGEVAMTTNPEHPYYVGEALTQTENPWDQLSEDNVYDLKPGDTVVDSATGHTTEVEAIQDGQVKTQAGTWTDFENVANQVDHAAMQEDITPEEAGLDGYEGWLDPWEGEEGGKPDLHPDDHVYYHDEDTGEMQVGRVESVIDGSDGIDPTSDAVEVDGDTIDREQVAGYADTGSVIAGMDTLDPGYVGDGEIITYYEENPYGDEPSKNRAYVTDANPSFHDNYIEVMDEHGETFAIYPEDEEYAVTDREQYPDTSDFFEGGGDGMDMETGELVDQFYDEVNHSGHDNYLSKAQTLGEAFAAFLKSEMQSIRTDFMTHFDPGEVDDFYDAISNWKHDSGNQGMNQRLEGAFKQALGIDARVRGTTPEDEYGAEPSDEWVKMAEVASKMSQRYWEDHVRHNTDGRLTRDASSTAFRSFLHEWAENPDAEEYELDGRALNNFQINPGSWNYWRVTPHEVPTENIGLMTDMMFNPMETNAHEDEVWVISDDLTVGPDAVGVGYDRKHDYNSGADFGGDIESWSETKTEEVGKELAQQYGNLTGDEYEVYRPDELSDAQVETFVRFAEHATELGVTKSNYQIKDFAETITQEAQTRNLLDAESGDLPTGVESIDDLRDGMEVTAWDSGEAISGEIVSAQPSTGDLVIENVDTGQQMMADPADIKDIHYSPEPYGPFDRLDPQSFEGDDFEPGTQAWFRPYSGGMEEVTVLDVQDDGTVEFSRPTGQSDFIHPQTDGRLLPQAAAEGPDDDGEWRPNDGEQVEIEVPDSVDYDGDTIIAPYTDEGDQTGVHYEHIPWIDNDDYGEEAVMSDLVNVDDYLVDPTDEAEATDFGPDDFSQFDDAHFVADDGQFVQGNVNEVTADELAVNYWDSDAEQNVDTTVDYDELVDIGAPIEADSVAEGDEVWYPNWDATGEVVDVMANGPGDEITGAKVQFDDGGYPEVLDIDSLYDPAQQYEAEGSTEAADDSTHFEPVGGSEDLSEGAAVLHEPEVGEAEETEVVDIKESGTVELANGANVISSAVSDTIEVAAEPSDEELTEESDILQDIEDEIDSIAPDDEPDEVLADEEDVEAEAEQLIDEMEADEEPDIDSAGLDAGDQLTVENFGGAEPVEVVDPDLPGDAVEVEAENGSTFTAYEGEILSVDETAEDSDEPETVPPAEWDDLDPGTAVELYEPSLDDSQGAEVVEVTETVGGDPALVVEAESGKTKTVKYSDSTEVHL